MKISAALHAVLCLGLAGSLIGGCASTPEPELVAGRVVEKTIETEEPTPSPSPTPSRPLDGITVSIDPGHNGGNFQAPAEIAVQVPNGRGGTKECDTTGTSTNDGYRESTFNLDVAFRLRSLLEAEGATVVMTRETDDGVGPCVDERGAFPALHDADLAISIHANGTTDPNVRGFFVLLADPPVAGEEIANGSRRLADAIITEMQAAGFPVSPNGAITPRSDIAGLNLNEVPAVLVELGEMRNPEEAAFMKTEDGRQQYADALAKSVLRWNGDE
ncbi:MAG: N-acetylmuramoyl-L-alanine amidase [Actinomycetaceae bacterium]|nr:N-acetylmuramoyl-L-alanine amidase [Actinomycetaceae bacterium]